jgi:hydrogenase expression/formation protein HypC
LQNDVTDLEELVGEWVLIHVGFAMSRIDELEAKRTLELLTELGEMQDEWQEAQTSLKATG